MFAQTRNDGTVKTVPYKATHKPVGNAALVAFDLFRNNRISTYHMAIIHCNGTSKPVPYKKRRHKTATHPLKNPHQPFFE